MEGHGEQPAFARGIHQAADVEEWSREHRAARVDDDAAIAEREEQPIVPGMNDRGGKGEAARARLRLERDAGYVAHRDEDGLFRDEAGGGVVRTGQG
jgi:hypothetical protein